MLKLFRKDIAIINALRSQEQLSQSDMAKALEKATHESNGPLSEYMAELQENESKVPKYFDVTISSLGLTPEKYTAAGAPSVTSDVILKLAGDPFANPPRYGTVSNSPLCPRRD